MCFSTLIKVKNLLQFNYECDNTELIIAAVKPGIVSLRTSYRDQLELLTTWFAFPIVQHWELFNCRVHFTTYTVYTDQQLKSRQSHRKYFLRSYKAQESNTSKWKSRARCNDACTMVTGFCRKIKYENIKRWLNQQAEFDRWQAGARLSTGSCNHCSLWDVKPWIWVPSVLEAAEF